MIALQHIYAQMVKVFRKLFNSNFFVIARIVHFKSQLYSSIVVYCFSLAIDLDVYLSISFSMQVSSLQV